MEKVGGERAAEVGPEVAARGGGGGAEESRHFWSGKETLSGRSKPRGVLYFYFKKL